MTRHRATNKEKAIRDKQILEHFAEAKKIYPFWKWHSLIEMVADKFNVSKITVYRSIRQFVKPQV